MTELEFMRVIGENIKNELDGAWMSQRELAEETKINESVISRYIRGETMPSLKNIVNIVYALDCDLEDIIPLRGVIK